MKPLSTILLALSLASSAFSQWSLTGNGSTNPPTNFLGTTDGQHLVFKTSGTEHLRLLTNGNLLLNSTTDNGLKLQVNGSIYSTGLKLDAGNSIYWGDPNTRIQRTTGNTLEFQEYTGQMNFTGFAGLNIAFTHPTNGAASFTFPAMKTFTIRNSQAYFIQSSAASGNCWLKLGDSQAQYATEPGSNVYVFGGIGGSIGTQNGGNVYLDGGEKGSVSATDGNILLGTQRGKVGIGTATPTTLLHVAGEGWITDKLKIGNFTAGTVTNAGIYTNSEIRAGGGFNVRDAAAMDQTFSGIKMSSNFIAVWHSNAPVGVFHYVGGGNSGSELTLSGGYNSTTGLTGTVNTLNLSPNVIPSGNSVEYRMLNIAPNLNSQNGSTGLIRGIYINPAFTTNPTFVAIESTAGNVVLNGGNVGVGTSSPAAQLHTTGTVRLAGLANDNTQARVVVSDANGNLSYRDVNTISGGGSANAWAHGGNTVTTELKFGTIDEFDLPLITNNTVRMRINGTTGNVGIGTIGISDAGYKLFVETGIRTRKVRVDQATWSDYVFYPGYYLRPLKEVEQYIQTHQHLPEVPSAAEVEKEGIDLGNNQALLLKKIEELTLYVIQQNKTIKAQQKIQQQQQERIIKLEKAMKKSK